MKPFPRNPFHQQGAVALVVVILLLVILSITSLMTVLTTRYEARAAQNEHRAKLAQQSAEASLSLAVEFMKANIADAISDEAGGWLAPGGRWVPCSTAVTAGQFDPCTALPAAPNAPVDQQYRYEFGGSTELPHAAAFPAATQLTSVNLGAEDTNLVTSVSAVLCRFDIDDPAEPVCELDPESPGQLAVTLVATASIPGEGAVAQAKETIGTFRIIGGAAPVPILASGTVLGLGNAEIVASPNAGGFGLPVSIWSPCPVDIESSGGGTTDPLCTPPGGGGVGSMSTCHMGEYLGTVPRDELFTTCATTNNCGCPNNAYGSLSGALGGSTRRENIDILDVDGGAGALPDIQYFPREPLDDPNDPLDDSIFEFVFAQDVVVEGQTNVAQTCGGGAEDCARVALESLSPVKIATPAECGTALGPSSSGLYWALAGCELNGGTVGSPEAPVVLVVEQDLHVRGNFVIYGMLFVRSSNNNATFRGNGGAKIFGMAVVEGTVKTNGGIQYIYSEEIRENINTSPAFQRFGRVAGTWLDASTPQ